jgi:hypothetical protein
MHPIHKPVKYNEQICLLCFLKLRQCSVLQFMFFVRVIRDVRLYKYFMQPKIRLVYRIFLISLHLV